MVLRKKWLAMLVVITALLFLAACGGNESSGAVTPQDGPQDSSEEDIMPVSEGFEKYSVWFETSNTPDRNSSVRAVYVFENGEVTSYYNISDQDKLKIEEINDLTDDEVIQYVKEVAQMKDSGKYTLDITLDSLGQDTEKMNVVLENYTHIWTFDIETLYAESGLSSKEEYIASLEEEGKEFEINGEYITFTSVKEEPKSVLSVNRGTVSQKIFDTNFAGLTWDDNAIVTRVDDSFVGFRLDSSDTDKENVTIEEYE